MAMWSCSILKVWWWIYPTWFWLDHSISSDICSSHLFCIHFSFVQSFIIIYCLLYFCCSLLLSPGSRLNHPDNCIYSAPLNFDWWIVMWRSILSSKRISYSVWRAWFVCFSLCLSACCYSIWNSIFCSDDFEEFWRMLPSRLLITGDWLCSCFSGSHNFCWQNCFSNRLKSLWVLTSHYHLFSRWNSLMTVLLCLFLISHDSMGWCHIWLYSYFDWLLLIGLWRVAFTGMMHAFDLTLAVSLRVCFLLGLWLPVSSQICWCSIDVLLHSVL